MESIFKFVNPLFESLNSSHYSLYVLLRQDGFSYLVTSETHRLLSLGDYSSKVKPSLHLLPNNWKTVLDETENHLSEAGLLGVPFKSVGIAFASPNFTLVPQTLIPQENVEELYKAAHELGINEIILQDPVIENGPCILLAVPQNLLDLSYQLFPSAHLHSASAIWVKGIMQAHSQVPTRQTFINIYSTFFEISILQGVRLLFLNAFKYNAPSDVLYYVIFVMEQLGLTPSEEEVVIMGYTEDKSLICEQLRLYCSKLTLANAPINMEFDGFPIGFSVHTYFTLLSLPLCG